jgi:hypothetical protein
LLPTTDLWKILEENWQPALAVNRWAEQPLPPALNTLKRFEAEGDRSASCEGQLFADFLGIPTTWQIQTN